MPAATFAEARRIGQADADRERRGDGRHDSVAGAGDIEDLADFGALDMDGAVGRRPAPTLGAERGENRVEAAPFDQRAGGRDDLAVGRNRHSRGVGELAPVRLQQIGAAIADVIAALRVDDDPRAGLARRPDDLERHPFGQHALGVIRDDDDRMVGHKLAREPQQIFADVGIERDRAFAIGAQQLLVAGDVARLDRGRALRLHENMRLGAVLRFDQAPDLAAGFVIADDGDERCRRPQRPQVAQHISGAAETSSFRARSTSTGIGASGDTRSTWP